MILPQKLIICMTGNDSAGMYKADYHVINIFQILQNQALQECDGDELRKLLSDSIRVFFYPRTPGEYDLCGWQTIYNKYLAPFKDKMFFFITEPAVQNMHQMEICLRISVVILGFELKYALSFWGLGRGLPCYIKDVCMMLHKTRAGNVAMLHNDRMICKGSSFFQKIFKDRY